MVNKAEQPEQQPIENPINTTVDVTDQFNDVDTPPEGSNSVSEADASPSTEPDTASTSEGTEQPSVEPPPPAAEAPVAQPPVDDLEKRIQEIEQQNIQYRAQQQQAELIQQKESYRTQLEGSGYLPEQATQLAEDWAATQSNMSKIQQEGLQRERFLQGQANAAEHFAKTYSLQLADLSELRKHTTPESMEEAAKRMKSDRDKDAEIAELRAKLVPSQSFDDNQSTPAASNDQDRWLDRYNQGDRSEQASAAARRAAGLG